MGKLIDIDKLDEFVYEDAYGCKCISLKDIEAQPVAYDVDAVVERFKELSSVDICDLGNCSDEDQCHECVKHRLIDKAIEIVKSYAEHSEE